MKRFNHLRGVHNYPSPSSATAVYTYAAVAPGGDWCTRYARKHSESTSQTCVGYVLSCSAVSVCISSCLSDFLSLVSSFPLEAVAMLVYTAVEPGTGGGICERACPSYKRGCNESTLTSPSVRHGCSMGGHIGWMLLVSGRCFKSPHVLVPLNLMAIHARRTCGDPGA
jgi:hypothetical protein